MNTVTHPKGWAQAGGPTDDELSAVVEQVSDMSATLNALLMMHPEIVCEHIFSNISVKGTAELFAMFPTHYENGTVTNGVEARFIDNQLACEVADLIDNERGQELYTFIVRLTRLVRS